MAERGVPSSLKVKRTLQLPLSEVTLRRSRSSGPGGQHANVTESKVEAIFDVQASTTLTPRQKQLLIARVGSVITATAQDRRSQHQNRELALERLAAKIREGLAQPKERRPTQVPKAAKRRRVEEKQQRSAKKAQRKPPLDF